MVAIDESINNRLKAMEEKALQPYAGFISSLQQVITLAANSRTLRKTVKQLLNTHYSEDKTHKTKSDSKTILNSINRYSRVLRRVAAFKVYERLFSLWHVLHLPLFFMMIITAVIHIFAVHMY